MARHAGQRPEGRRYSFAQHGQSTQGGIQGNYILRPGAAKLWRPGWGGGATTFRIFPVRAPENQQVWDPFRWSGQSQEFGDWIRRYPAVRNMGQPGVTFITHDPADSSVDPQMLPGWVLYNAVNNLVTRKQDPGWGGYLKGSDGQGAQLPKPSEVFLVQAAIMQFKNKVYTPPKGAAPDNELIVVELSSQGGQVLTGMLDEEKPGYSGPEDDYDNRFIYGDPISLQHGRYVSFYKLADGDPRLARQMSQQTSPRAATEAFGVRPQAAGFRQGGGMADNGWGVYIEPTFNGLSANLTGFEHILAEKTKPWDQILNFPTVEEQAALLADKFPAQMILYAWNDHQEWIPESVRRRAVNPTTVPSAGIPGATAPGAAPFGVRGPAGFQHQPGAQGAPFGQPAEQPQPDIGVQHGGIPAQLEPVHNPAPGAAWPGGFTNTAATPAPQPVAQPTELQPSAQAPGAAIGFGAPTATPPAAATPGAPARMASVLERARAAAGRA